MCDAITYMYAAINSHWCVESDLHGWSNASERKPMLESRVRCLKAIIANGACIPVPIMTTSA